MAKLCASASIFAWLKMSQEILKVVLALISNILKSFPHFVLSLFQRNGSSRAAGGVQNVWHYNGGIMIQPKNLSGTEEENKKFMRLQCKLFSFLCRFNLLPFKWDKEEHQFVNHSSPWYFRLWFVTVAMWSWAVFSFVLYRFVQAIFHHWRTVQKNDLSQIIGLWTTLTFRSIICVATYELSTGPEMIVGFANQVLKLRKDGNEFFSIILLRYAV